jgi:hypothetical protein
MDFSIRKEIIESESYAGKFEGITMSEKGDRLVADYARKAVLDDDGIGTEDVYFLNAKNGRLIKHQKLGELGGSVPDVPSVKKGEEVIVVHNHPNSASFSFADFVTLNDYPEVSVMIAAGHDGTVYFMSVCGGRRLDLSDHNEYLYYEKAWQRMCRDLGGEYGAMVKMAKGLEWKFYVK